MHKQELYDKLYKEVCEEHTNNFTNNQTLEKEPVVTTLLKKGVINDEEAAYLLFIHTEEA